MGATRRFSNCAPAVAPSASGSVGPAAAPKGSGCVAVFASVVAEEESTQSELASACAG